MALKLLSPALLIIHLWSWPTVDCGQLMYSNNNNNNRVASYSINVRKPIHIVSEKFLSLTVDPDTLLHSSDCEMSKAAMNMAKGLAPAYIRIGGPNSNKYIFQPSLDSTLTERAIYKRPDNSKNFTITGLQWTWLNNFISESGLDMIVCLNGDARTERGLRDLSNALELISFSDKFDYNLGWQLGYELQKIANDRGKEMGRDVARLRKILEAFPNYYNSPIIGPDMIAFESRSDATFIKNYLMEAGNSLNMFTWHPNFSNLKEDEDPANLLHNTLAQLDNYIWMKDGLLKPISRGIIPKKPIWIGESEIKSGESSFKDAMLWARKLGSAAKLGISVYMRKPHQLSLFEPTPEYWVALFHKALIGRIVLDIRATNGNNTKFQVFSHCTQILEKPEQGVINPSLKYVKGGITVFGVNTGYEKARLSLKVGFKSEESQPIHQYVLTETRDENTYSSKVLLNGQMLSLSEDDELPMFSPKIRTNSRPFAIPARSIFFFVLPEAKCKVCSNGDEWYETSKSRKINAIADEEEEYEVEVHSNTLQEAIEEDADDNVRYITFPKRTNNLVKSSANSNRTEESKLSKAPKPKEESITPEQIVKYVTFSDDTWLSSFPNKLKNGAAAKLYADDDDEDDSSAEDEQDEFKETPTVTESEVNKEQSANKIGKYKIFARAILGKRNSTNANENPKTVRKDKDIIAEEINSHLDEEPKYRKSSRYERSANEDDYYPDYSPETDFISSKPDVKFCRQSYRGRFYYPRRLLNGKTKASVILLPYEDEYDTNDNNNYEEAISRSDDEQLVERLKDYLETEDDFAQGTTSPKSSDTEKYVTDERTESANSQNGSSEPVPKSNEADIIGNDNRDKEETDEVAIDEMIGNEIEDLSRRKREQVTAADISVFTETMPTEIQTEGTSSQIVTESSSSIVASESETELLQQYESTESTSSKTVNSFEVTENNLVLKEVETSSAAPLEFSTPAVQSSPQLESNIEMLQSGPITDSELSPLNAAKEEPDNSNNQRGSRDTLERAVQPVVDDVLGAGKSKPVIKNERKGLVIINGKIKKNEDGEKEKPLIVSPFGKKKEQKQSSKKYIYVHKLNVVGEPHLTEKPLLLTETAHIHHPIPVDISPLISVTAPPAAAAAAAANAGDEAGNRKIKLDKSNIDKLRAVLAEKRQIRLNELQNRYRNRLTAIRKQLGIAEEDDGTRRRRQIEQVRTDSVASAPEVVVVGGRNKPRRPEESSPRQSRNKGAGTPTGRLANGHRKHERVSRSTDKVDEERKVSLQSALERILERHENRMKDLQNTLQSRLSEIQDKVNSIKTNREDPKHKRETDKARFVPGANGNNYLSYQKEMESAMNHFNPRSFPEKYQLLQIENPDYPTTSYSNSYLDLTNHQRQNNQPKNRFYDADSFKFDNYRYPGSNRYKRSLITNEIVDGWDKAYEKLNNEIERISKTGTNINNRNLKPSLISYEKLLDLSKSLRNKIIDTNKIGNILSPIKSGPAFNTIRAIELAAPNLIADNDDITSKINQIVTAGVYDVDGANKFGAFGNALPLTVPGALKNGINLSKITFGTDPINMIVDPIKDDLAKGINDIITRDSTNDIFKHMDNLSPLSSNVKSSIVQMFPEIRKADELLDPKKIEFSDVSSFWNVGKVPNVFDSISSSENESIPNDNETYFKPDVREITMKMIAPLSKLADIFMSVINSKNEKTKGTSSEKVELLGRSEHSTDFEGANTNSQTSAIANDLNSAIVTERIAEILTTKRNLRHGNDENEILNDEIIGTRRERKIEIIPPKENSSSNELVKNDSVQNGTKSYIKSLIQASELWKDSLDKISEFWSYIQTVGIV